MAIKPLVFIPGFPASELRQVSTGKTFFPPDLGDLTSEAKKNRLTRLLIGPDVPPGDVVAGEPIRALLQIGKVELAKRAQALYDLLRNSYDYTIHSGDNFRAVGWDWRRAIDAAEVQRDVVASITDLSAANGGAQVVVLAHSTGGLVLRRLLELQPGLAARIEQILALGVPWAGNLAAVRILVKGEKIGLGPASLDAARVRDVMRHAQAAYDLFPADPAPGKTDMRSPSGQPLDLFVADGPGPRQQLGPLVDLRWIRAADAAERQRIQAMAAAADLRLGIRPSEIRLPGGVPTPPITNIVGWGVEMDTTCVMSASGALAFERSKEGDGTAGAASAGWLRGANVRTHFVPIGIYPTNNIPFHHSLIWDSPPLRQIFDEVLRDRARSPYVCGSADSDEASDPQSDVTIRLVAADPLGRPLPNARLQFRNLMPQPRPFGNRPRINVVLRKQDIRPDAQRLFHFSVHIQWDAGPAGPGDAREVTILFKR